MYKKMQNTARVSLAIAFAAAFGLFLFASISVSRAHAEVIFCGTSTGATSTSGIGRSRCADGARLIVGTSPAEGPQGPQGEQGPQGPEGPQGDTGATGPQGETGDTGPQGPTGVAGADGESANVVVSEEPDGDNCEAGGQKVETSVGDEAPQVSYICNGIDGTNGTGGSNGSNALVKVTDEPAGPNCAFGGEKVESGVDTNNNTVLDGLEITSTSYVCDGAPGAEGAPGTPGDPGAPGTPGPQGLKGDTGDTGPQGDVGPQGPKGDQGDVGPQGPAGPAGETGPTGPQGPQGIQGAQGPQGLPGADGLDALVFTTTLDVGDLNCPEGGQKIETGVDSNGNGTAEPEELETSYVCNGQNGADGAPGATGPAGRSALTPLVAGETIHGGIGLDTHAGPLPPGSENGQDFGTIMTLPIPANEALTDADVIAAGPNSEESPADLALCPGLGLSTPGVLCIYYSAESSDNIALVNGYSIVPGAGGSPYGFKLAWSAPTENADTFIDAVWEYIAAPVAP